MKKSLLVFWILLLLGTTTYAQTVSCADEDHLSKALKFIPKDFIFTKSYRVDGQKGAKRLIEYNCVMSKNTEYAFTIYSKDGGANGIIFSILDGKQNILGTNHESTSGKDVFRQEIHYKANHTGVHYIKITFKNTTSYCGVVVQSFKRIDED